ncbi:MAG: LLM class flavin-dependent oxidoreductase [Alphaproteobacteria bacterium]|nr:LLM class flavin-dependent oxidoreductase [Alphaproteobacteria bacterium]
MHVGMSVVFQNPDRARPDHEVWRDDLKLADLAEPLGFDSIWTVEHHFTDYMLAPNPMQFLTYMAGRTKSVRLGSMVMVLPWHDPMWQAEQIAMLDTISEGRLILGIGRGAALVEFDGFGVPMEESRPRFNESAQMLLEGLEQGYCAFDGEYIKQPRRDIRPQPSRTFKGRTYAASVSPESLPVMVRLGVGLLIIPQKPWAEVEKELATYRAAYREMHKTAAPAPIFAGWTFVDESADRAEEMAQKYIGGYFHSVLAHYEFASAHMKTTRGYEYYGKITDKIAEVGEEQFVEFFKSLQVFGTPEQCLERILGVRERLSSETFVGVFSYTGMPHEEAERNLRLFVKEVMPALKALEPLYAEQPDVA